MRFVSDSQRRAVFALYKKGDMLYSDVYPDVAVESNFPADIIAKQLTDLRDPRQPEYGEHLLKYTPSIKTYKKLPDANTGAEFEEATHNIKMHHQPRENVLVHELGHAIYQQKIDDVHKRIKAASSDGPVTLSSLRKGIDDLNLYLYRRDNHEDVANDFEFRRVPRIEEHISEYSTPTFDELIAIGEGFE